MGIVIYIAVLYRLLLLIPVNLPLKITENKKIATFVSRQWYLTVPLNSLTFTPPHQSWVVYNTATGQEW